MLEGSLTSQWCSGQQPQLEFQLTASISHDTHVRMGLHMKVSDGQFPVAMSLLS